MHRGRTLPSQFSSTTRSLAVDTGRTSLWLWSIAAVALLAWLGWFCFGSVTVYGVSTQARLEVQQAAHPVSSLLAGRVVSNPLSIGMAVQAGDVLVELDAGPQSLKLREEEARLAAIAPRVASIEREIALMEQARSDDLKSAAAAIDSARLRIREATVSVDFSRDNERRLQEESRQGGVARVEALRAQAEALKLAAGRDAMDSDLRRIEADAQARASQALATIENLRRLVVSLEGDAGTSRATIDRLQADIDRHRIRAPVSGRIGDIVPMRPGAYVAEGMRLASVVPVGEMAIVADFDPATVLGRVRPGQSARMRLDGFPWAQYGTISATVSRVATEIRDNRVRVEFVPDRLASTTALPMQHGLPGSIEVGIEQLSPAILVLRASGQFLARGATMAAPPPPSPSQSPSAIGAGTAR